MANAQGTLQLFEEMKQRFPNISESTIRNCIMQNSADRDKCLSALLQERSIWEPMVTVSSYAFNNSIGDSRYFPQTGARNQSYPPPPYPSGFQQGLLDNLNIGTSLTPNLSNATQSAPPMHNSLNPFEPSNSPQSFYMRQPMDYQDPPEPISRPPYYSQTSATVRHRSILNIPPAYSPSNPYSAGKVHSGVPLEKTPGRPPQQLEQSSHHSGFSNYEIGRERNPIYSLEATQDHNSSLEISITPGTYSLFNPIVQGHMGPISNRPTNFSNNALPSPHSEEYISNRSLLSSGTENISSNLLYNQSRVEVAHNRPGVATSSEDDHAYVQALLQHQKARLDLLQKEFKKSKDYLSNLKTQVNAKERELYKRVQRNTSVEADETQKLHKDITKLRVECHCLSMEVDLLTKEPVPLCVTDEDFYRNIFTGQRAQITKSIGSLIESTPILIAPAVPSAASGVGEAAAASAQNHLEEEDEEKRWKCQSCTFENHPALNKCEMCDTEKPTFGDSA